MLILVEAKELGRWPFVEFQCLTKISGNQHSISERAEKNYRFAHHVCLNKERKYVVISLEIKNHINKYYFLGKIECKISSRTDIERQSYYSIGEEKLPSS